MTAQHTPGPWTAHAPDAELDPHHWTVRALLPQGFGSFEVCRVSGRNVATDEATAHLIAAAPDLLEIVRTSICNVRSLGPAGALGSIPYSPYEVWLKELEAAYTKATGSTS
jgi:hypothetical protein